MANLPSRTFCWGLLALVLGSLTTSGCSPWMPRGKSPLRPATMSADAVTLDIIFLKCPAGDAEINGPLWDQLDEQICAADLRTVLAANGFRVGVTGAPLPTSLEKLLDQTVVKPPSTGEAPPADLQNDSQVSGRIVQLRAGKRNEIQASRVFDELPVLFPNGELLQGRTYTKAQGVFILKAQPLAGGRVKLELLPELQHGEQASRYTSNQEGMWLMEPGRNREGFENLKMEITLTPGEFLVLSSNVARSGSLGDHFFNDRQSSPRTQKLLLIRIAAENQLAEF